MHEELQIKKSTRWLVSFIVILVCAILLKPFMISQIITRGDGYLGYCMYKDAVREYKKALWFNPNMSGVWNWLGYAYRNAGDRESAIKTYEKAIEINSDNIAAYYDLGMIYALEKDYKHAKEYFLKASSIFPEHKKEDIIQSGIDYYRSSLEMFSICQERLGQIREAINTNRKVLECYPDNKIARERIKRLENLEGGE